MANQKKKINKKRKKSKSVKTKPNSLKVKLKKRRKVTIAVLVLLSILVPILTIFIVNNIKDNQNKINIAAIEKANQEKEASRVATDPITPMGLLAVVNKTRAAKGLQLLTPISNLEIAAQQGCADLVAGNYFDYVNPSTGKRLNSYMVDNEGSLFVKTGLADIMKSTVGKQTAAELIGPKIEGTPAFNTVNYNSIGIATCKAPSGPNDIYIVAMVAEVTSKPPNGSANTTGANNPTSTNAQQTAPQNKFEDSVCTKTYIPKPPPITVVKDYMYATDAPYYAGLGYEGWVQTCTTNSGGIKPEDYRVEPRPDEIWIGTKQPNE